MSSPLNVTADQVTIDVDNALLDANKQNESLNLGMIAVDGRRHGHQRHGSGGSHHHSHSGDNDADTDRHGHRRNRRRSRSRSRSPSPSRTKRTTDTGVNLPFDSIFFELKF